METRSICRVHVAVLAAYLAAAATLWPSLPRRIPIHFDFTGQATWTQTSIMSWFGLPLVALATAFFLYGITRASTHTPELWNIPEKERFLALSPAERAPIVDVLHRLVAWVALLTTCIFIIVHVAVYRAATGADGPSWETMLGAGSVITLLVLTMSTSRNIGERIRHAGSGSTPRGSD